VHRHKASPQFVNLLKRLALGAACALLVAAPGARPGFAQITLPGLAMPAPAAAPAAPPALTPGEAKQMLSLLNDPQKRAAFAATLETLSKATPATAPKPTEGPEPLAANSVGAQVISESITWLSGLSHQFASFGLVQMTESPPPAALGNTS